MRKTREYVHEYAGGGPGIVGLCGVRIFEAEGARPVVVLSEPPEDTGYDGPSVTNCVEQIAAEVALGNPSLAGLLRSSAEDGAEAGCILFVEHYPRCRAEKRRGAPETFDLVRFASWEPRPVRWGAGSPLAFGEADWEHLGDEEAGRGRAEAIVGGPLAAPGDDWLPRFRQDLARRLPPRAEVGDAGSPRGHGRREHEHGMHPPLPWDPETGDVRLRRVPDFERGLNTGDELVHLVQTNVPWSVVDHSPTGFEWGYYGQGPADLALNILNLFEPPGADGQEPVGCWDGEASRTAHALHQAFKEDFLAKMPAEGGMIRGTEIRAWISERVVRDGGEAGTVVGYVPRGARAV